MSFMNEAGWDRIARVILGVVMLVLGWGGIVDGVSEAPTGKAEQGGRSQSQGGRAGASLDW